MAETDRLLYLEPDDEITSVIRRLRAAEPGRVVIVAPARCRAISSAVSVRLLARVAQAEGRSLVIVTDAAGRAMAARAGLAAFASVAELGLDGPPAELIEKVDAPIRIVRGPTPTQETIATPAAASPAPSPSPPRARTGIARAPRIRLAAAAALGLVLVGGAVVLPAATIRIEPASVAVGPIAYSLDLEPSGTDRGLVTERAYAAPTGERIELLPAVGSVVLSNWNSVVIEVPAGTRLAAGDVVFVTDAAVQVPAARFAGFGDLLPGVQTAAITAEVGGVAGNLPAGSIHSVLDRTVAGLLRAFQGNPNPIVTNNDPTSGGGERTHSVVTQADIDALAADLGASLLAELAGRIAARQERIYPAPLVPDAPRIGVPASLVGREDLAEFSLIGSVEYARPYLLRSTLERAAVERLLSDPGATPAGTALVRASIEAELGTVSIAAGGLRGAVMVRGTATALIDAGAVREIAAGLTAGEAIDALAELGTVQVELWPGWVDRVPGLGLRVTVETVVAESSASPSASPSAPP